MNLNKRNYPPDHGIRIPAQEIHTLLVDLFLKVEMANAEAELLAGILTRNNRRCIYSHGTGQVPHYLQKIKEGSVNPRPKIVTVRESPGALVIDGDGGLGYFPCWNGTEQIIEKAMTGGVAVLTTHNHHHFGSAGNYTRMAIDHDCIGMAVSAHRTYLNSEDSIARIIDSSPISISVPAGDQPPFTMDMGGGLLSFDEELFDRLPNSFFKSMALSAAIRSLGGVFAGIYRESVRKSKWESNQGAFIAVINVAHFMPVDELKTEMDRFISEARKMRPVPGMDSTELAGGNEWLWDKENKTNGIPLSDEHINLLQIEADSLDVQTPFSRYEHTRF